MSKILLFPLLLLFAFSCSEEEKKVTKKESKFNVSTDNSFQKNAVSLISSQKNIVAYGSVKMNQLLTKGIVNSALGETAFIKSALKDMEKLAEYMDMAVPIYFAVQSEKDENSPLGVNMNFFIFGKVKNQKKIIQTVMDSNPTAVETKSNTCTVIEDGPMAIAVSKNQFIGKVSSTGMIQGISTGNYVGNSQEEMNQLMSNLNANNTNPDIQAHFDDSKDITMAFNYKELLKMYEAYMPLGYYPQTDIQSSEWINSSSMNIAFENGEMNLILKSQYTDAMNEFNFFHSNTRELIKKLGSGEAAGALAANINVEEIERFRKKYYPESISNQLNNSGIPMIEEFLPDELPMIEALIMKDGITSFMDGRFGGALFFDENQEPQASFNFFMGIGPNLKNMISEGAEMLGAFLHQFELDDEHIAGYSSPSYMPSKGQSIGTNKFAEFGEKPISMFIDLSKIPTEGLLSGIDRSLRDYEVFLELIEIVSMEFDMNGGEISIKLKDKNKNALTVMMNELTELLPKLMLQMI